MLATAGQKEEWYAELGRGSGEPPAAALKSGLAVL